MLTANPKRQGRISGFPQAPGKNSNLKDFHENLDPAEGHENSELFIACLAVKDSEKESVATQVAIFNTVANLISSLPANDPAFYTRSID